MTASSVGLVDALGLRPFGKTWRELRFALTGDPYTPASRWDRTSLSVLAPGLSVATWLGRRRSDGRVPIYNYFNRTPTPVEDGWSVRKTQARDWRGGTRTYDSHNGTDFAVPVGTIVVAAAAGRVAHVRREFHRGGLKVVIDHGRGLLTTSNHLSRALVTEGDVVRRAQPIALSGASGIDGFLLFPWNAPHVHFNVWLNGEPIDPFAVDGEACLWRVPNDPRPHAGAPDADPVEPNAWDDAAIAATVAACRDPELRSRLEETPRDARALEAIFQTNYFPTRFAQRPCLYATTFAREPRLDLPFRADDVTGVVDLD